jgi:hypothetical protein
MSTFQTKISEATPIARPRPRPTTCHNGFSAWHLVALGLFVDHYIEEFSATLSTIPTGELVDDLRETTWRYFPLPYYQEAFFRRHGIPLARVNRLLLYRDVKQLCELTGVPLFGYWDVPVTQLHPVVKAFNACLKIPRGPRG